MARAAAKREVARRAVARNNRFDVPGWMRDYTWGRLKRLCDGRCYYCGEPTERPQLEHRTPLARGGRHIGTNLVPACELCNRRKGTRTEAEYLAAWGWEQPRVYEHLTRRQARTLRRFLRQGW